jgi:hypothetical protein
LTSESTTQRALRLLNEAVDADPGADILVVDNVTLAMASRELFDLGAEFADQRLLWYRGMRIAVMQRITREWVSTSRSSR